jgi:predicted DNA binding CopG/RHH family protein
MSTTNSDRKRSHRPPASETQIVGFRLPIPLAKAIKAEAAKRGMPLNHLMEEFWKTYREARRAG